jgi:hypothetical protein
MNKTKKKGKLLKAKFTATLLKSSKKGGWTYVAGRVPSSFLALVVWLRSEARSMVIRFEARSWLWVTARISFR